MSSRGYLTDMMESIAEKIALTSHIEEKLRGSEDEEEIQRLKTLLDKTLTLRRKQMSRLLSKAENPNPFFWCQFKHALGAFMRDCEVYEATGEDSDLEIAKESADILAMNTSLFLGMEFTTCARCLADKLLVKQVEEKTNTKSVILETNEGEQDGKNIT